MFYSFCNSASKTMIMNLKLPMKFCRKSTHFCLCLYNKSFCFTFQVLILIGCLIAVSLGDFAARDLRRFARAKQLLRQARQNREQQQPQSPRALRPLKRVLKDMLKPSESKRFTDFDSYGQSQRVGVRQTPGPLGYLAHVLRLLSYLVSL